MIANSLVHTELIVRKEFSDVMIRSIRVNIWTPGGVTDIGQLLFISSLYPEEN